MARRESPMRAQAGVGVMPSGQLFIYRGTHSNVLATSVQGLGATSWYYIELKATIDAVGGSVELRVNGSPWISVSGVDTLDTANAWTDELSLAGWNEDNRFDDLYVCDTAGAVNNDFLGDCRVITLAPDSDVSVNDFTPQGGGAHYVEVDDGASGSDEDASYVSASAVGAKDLYGCVSRVLPVHTAVRNCTRDEGGPFGFGDQELIPSYRKLLWSKAMVVSVAEKSGR